MRLSRFLARSLSFVAVATAIAPGVAAAAAPVPVTACGQTVAKRGVLTGDLDCSAFDGPAIVLGKSSRLDLAGFTLIAKDAGVLCGGAGACEVRGPGTIRRPAYDPDVDFFAGEGFGIRAFRSVRVRDVTLQYWNRAIFSLDGALVRSSTIKDGGAGVMAGPVRVIGSTFTDNVGAGVHAYSGTKDGVHHKFYACNVRTSTFAGNAVDIESYREPVVKDSSCTTSDRLTIPSTPYGGGDYLRS